MSDTEANGTQSAFERGAPPVEHALARAEELVAHSDVDGALALLSALEQDYVSGVRLFNLLGDIFLQRGETQLGVRYKVLHEVLRGTFQIAMEETRRHRDFSIRPEIEPKRRPADGEIPAAFSASGESKDIKEFLPVTAAMAHELMRQGHYDQALQIFTILSLKSPEDLSLKKARDHARKRCNEKRIVGILQGWLGGINKIKSDQSAGA